MLGATLLLGLKRRIRTPHPFSLKNVNLADGKVFIKSCFPLSYTEKKDLA